MSTKLTQPKRLLAVVGSYYPAVGGGEHANQQLARLAMEDGWEVLVVAPTSNACDSTDIDPSGVPVHYIPARNFAHHRLIPSEKLRRCVEQFKPHVIQFDGPNLHDFYGVRIARSKGIRAIGMYHADYRDDNVISRAATRIYGRTILRLFDHVCVTSESYRQRLVQRGILPDRITNIGLGADLDIFHPASNYEERTTSSLLFVGRLDENHSYKRFDLLLEAISILKSRGKACHLRVVGDGGSRVDAQRLARSLGLEKEVSFLGSVSQLELATEYRDADLLVLPSPSKSEGFGMVLVEAYASGCPGVTSVLAGGREVIDVSGVGALWNGRDIGDLVRAIESSVATGAQRAAIAARARTVAESSYSWASVGRRLCALLNQFLK